MKAPKYLLSIKNNRGGALITVVISMLFVIALGSSLLYTAYVGYSVSVTDRGEKDNFYSAESSMKHIVSGIQGIVSDALVSAYTKTLTEYAKGSITNPQSELTQNLITELSETKIISNNCKNYSNIELAKFLDGALSVEGGTVKVTFDDGSNLVLENNDSIEKVIDENGFGFLKLKEISILYTSLKGFETKISSDVKINIPEFFTAGFSSSETGEYAIVAENGLIHNTGNSEVIGNVFVSGSGIITNGNTFILNGNVVSKGGIKVSSGSHLLLSGSNNELWTDDIILGNVTSSGLINLDGKIYVADDLRFEGKNSSAILSGEYFGFGSGDSISKSSAILVNAQNSKLNISGLDKLLLAGVSYIDVSTGDIKSEESPYKTPILMGQSIAAKTDQLAYLLPPECISNYLTNPCVLKSQENDPNTKIKPEFVNSTVLWTINGVDKTLEYYLEGGKGKILPLYSQGGDIAYIFIAFQDRKAANEYFSDYFSVYPQRISQYTNLYITELSGKAKNIYSAGNTFYSDGNKYSLQPADTKVLTGNLSTRYKNKLSPFDKYVKREKLNEINNTLYFVDDNGKEVAVIANGNYQHFGTNKDLKLIVAKGDVTINGNFNGIILSVGKVTVNGNVSAEAITPNILNSKCNGYEGLFLSDFIRVSTSSGAENAWDLNKLVFCENWKKN